MPTARNALIHGSTGSNATPIATASSDRPNEIAAWAKKAGVGPDAGGVVAMTERVPARDPFVLSTATQSLQLSAALAAEPRARLVGRGAAAVALDRHGQRAAAGRAELAAV